MLSQNVLLESSSARSSLLSTRTHSQSLELLNKAKAVIMATWQGTGHATTEQVAEFYNSPVSTVKEHLQNHREEFVNEVKKIVGKELQELKRDSRLASSIGFSASQLILWTPRGMHRLGFMLRDSEVAKHVRDVTLDVVEAVPNIVNEIDCEFIESFQKLAKMQEILGISDNHPNYQKVFDLIVAREFGTQPTTHKTVVPKSKSRVDSTQVKQECLLIVADTITRHVQIGEQITISLLSRQSIKFRKLNTLYPQYIAFALEILCEACYLQKAKINIQGDNCFIVNELPVNEDILKVFPL